MASFKNKKNLLQGRDEYARYFDNLRGVDFSSDQNDVADNRFAYLVNMYRDYKSGQGGAIETIPGFRKIIEGDVPINGIHVGDRHVYIHAGSWLYEIGFVLDNGTVDIYDQYNIVSPAIVNDKTTSFFYQGYLYILGGGAFYRIEYSQGQYPRWIDVRELAYLPTTYHSIDPAAENDSIPEDYGKGYEYEQRNLLTEKFRNTFIADGSNQLFKLKSIIDVADFDVKYVSDSETNNESLSPKFPTKIEVYQYGVKLPFAYGYYDSNNNDQVDAPQGFPNAIRRIRNGKNGGIAEVELAFPPPRPEVNTWNPVDRSFDYTEDEIQLGKPKKDFYTWPYAYSERYDGIEIIAPNEINVIGGEILSSDQASIITNCRLAALFDEHIFLSGNPDMPRLLFYNALRNDGKTADATFWGQLNYDTAGISSAGVVAMMSVGDSLMVLKKDSDEDDSIILHTAESTGEKLNPKIYPSQRGHKGIGCLGPCFNFRDDPVFLTKLGVDALGHVSTKYRRAIKHRSSMIDARLNNLDLSEATMTEWDGYLMIMVKGRVFMADSRQMYNTESGNTEYEWYYLEDIGVYDNEFDECVYAKFPIEVSEETILATTGLPIIEARSVRDENGKLQDLIGRVAFNSPEEITYVQVGENRVYYKKVQEYNEYTGPIEGSYLYLYVEPSGARMGGEFDPGVTIKAIGNDLFFATEKGRLCKFNFDKRDPETGIIPNEYYDFNGRTIFSGCATKMDNCGIPHLTKNTVKRSTVIKTRTFKASGAKVKIRTNRKPFNQIARITNGWATFDDPSFEDYTFSTTDKSIFSVNEKEKKWVEKQIFVYSDEFRRPFAIHYLAYRYNIAGRYKE